MDNKTLRCTYCGARLPDSTDEKVVCPYCESVNYLRFAKKTGEDDAAQIKLENLRARLYDCVNARYHDFQEMKEISDEILNLNGYDFEAKYFYALALKKNNKRNKYLEFLSDAKNLAPNAKSLELVMNNVIRYAKENERSVIKKFIEINVSDELAALEYADRADRQIERASKFFHGGQDVFVCHKSSDGAIAETVVARLESEGITCFLSERNLEDLEIGEKFERALVQAIASTKVFLLISSYAAFDTSQDNYVLFEIEEARKLNKPNAEFRIDNIDKETQLRAGAYMQYFNGCQYIDAYPAYADMLDKLALQLRLKLDRQGDARSETAERIRMEERAKAEAEVAAQIERLKAEKTAYQQKLQQLTAEKPTSNTDTQRSEKDEVDAVFGYAAPKTADVNPDAGEEYYRAGLDYDFGRNGKIKDKVKAVYYYTKAAECGNALAQLNLGVCYEYGDGIRKNHKKAVALYVAASEQGNAMAQCNLGYCYFNGVGVEKNAVKAVLWYKKAADGGNVRAMNNLGYCYENGAGVMCDKRRAFEMYKKAADGGDVNGACNAAWCYEAGIGTKTDAVKARQYNALAKEAGSSRAAKAYARLEEKLYACGEDAENLYERALKQDTGERRNAAKAAALYAKAAKAGSVRAAYNLGVFYLRGDGVKKDLGGAFNYFSQAAAKEHLGALYNLGYCYEKGVGTAVDKIKACACYERAAKAGYAAAQYAYGCFMESGLGGVRDYGVAVSMYERAARQGMSEADVALGLMYGTGTGVNADREKAKSYYKSAAQAGDEIGLYNYGCMVRDDGLIKEAKSAFNEAAAKGYTPAMFNLGKLSEQEGDRAAALKYFRIGAQAGDESCLKAVERLA